MKLSTIVHDPFRYPAPYTNISTWNKSTLNMTITNMSSKSIATIAFSCYRAHTWVLTMPDSAFFARA